MDNNKMAEDSNQKGCYKGFLTEMKDLINDLKIANIRKDKEIKRSDKTI